MKDNTLLQFYKDKNTREAVLNFILSQLDQYALQKMYDRSDVSGIPDAKEVIERSFSELENIYGKEKAKEVLDPAE